MTWNGETVCISHCGVFTVVSSRRVVTYSGRLLAQLPIKYLTCNRRRDNSSCTPASFPHSSGTVRTAQYCTHCSGTVRTTQVLYALLRYCTHCSGTVCTPQVLYTLLRYCSHCSGYCTQSSGNVYISWVMYACSSGTVHIAQVLYTLLRYCMH